MTNPIRSIGVLALAAVAGMLSSPTWSQADYPSKPIRLVVAYPPGGTVDIFARLIGGKLSERLNQPVVIENRAGGNGVVGGLFAAKSAPDGYTLFSSNGVVYSPAFMRDPPFDFLREFTPISQTSYGGLFFFVRSDLPVRNLKEFVEYARARPGKLNYGAPSPNTMLAMEVFKQQNGIDVLHVPYKGAAPNSIGLLGGDVQVTIDTLPPYRPLIEAGKLRALAVTSDNRAQSLPNVPTLAEAGLQPLRVLSRGALWAPTGTPRPIIDKLNSTVAEVLRLPDVQEAIRAAGQIPEGSTPEALRQALVAEMEFWVSAAKIANYRPD